GAPMFPPRALCRREYLGLRSHKHLLLLRLQLHHRPTLVWVSERSENPIAHAKVGVPHVSALNCVRHLESQLPKSVRCHLAEPVLLVTPNPAKVKSRPCKAFAFAGPRRYPRRSKCRWRGLASTLRE